MGSLPFITVTLAPQGTLPVRCGRVPAERHRQGARMGGVGSGHILGYLEDFGLVALGLPEELH